MVNVAVAIFIILGEEITITNDGQINLYSLSLSLFLSLSPSLTLSLPLSLSPYPSFPLSLSLYFTYCINLIMLGIKTSVSLSCRIWVAMIYFKLYSINDDYNYTTYIKQYFSMLVGTDVCVRMVFVWEETGVTGGNPPVWLGDHMAISHADAGYLTRVAAVRGECVKTVPARQPCYHQWVALFSQKLRAHLRLYQREAMMLCLNRWKTRLNNGDWV